MTGAPPGKWGGIKRRNSSVIMRTSWCLAAAWKPLPGQSFRVVLAVTLPTVPGSASLDLAEGPEHPPQLTLQACDTGHRLEARRPSALSRACGMALGMVLICRDSDFLSQLPHKAVTVEGRSDEYEVSGRGEVPQPSTSVFPDVLSWCLVPKVRAALLSILSLFKARSCLVSAGAGEARQPF